MIFVLMTGASSALADAHGFAYYIDVTLAPSVVIAGPALRVRVDVTDQALRPGSTGVGRVQSTSGYDVRFYPTTAGGGALTYNLVSYDPTTGHLIADVRLSTAGGAAAALVVRFGNGTFTTNGSDPTGVAAGPIDQTVASDLDYALQVSTFQVASQSPLLDAPHLAATLNPGAAYDFPVLSTNAGATLASVGFPPSGTATATASGIHYVAGSETGLFTWRYTLTKSGQTDYGFLRVSVVAAAVAGGGGQAVAAPPPPESPAPAPAADPPDAPRVVPVDPTTVAAALAAALPGDQIVLADGSYPRLVVAVGGTPGAPVVVRAASQLGARVAGVTLQADHAWAYGLDVTPGANQVLVQGADCRLVRCRQLGFTSGGAGTPPQPCAIVTGTDAVLQYCEFGAIGTSGGSVQGRGVLVDVANGGTGCRVTRCAFHDIYGDAGTDGHEALVIGTYDAALMASGAVVEYCRFDDCSVNSLERSALAVNAGGTVVQFNTFVDSRRVHNFSGGGNLYQGNYCDGPQAGIVVRDAGARLLGNKTVTGLGLRVPDGKVSPADWSRAPSPVRTQSGERCLLAGNDAHDTQVGFPTDGTTPALAVDTRIEAHLGPVTLRNESGTTQVATTAAAVPGWVMLAPSQVGPAAP